MSSEQPLEIKIDSRLMTITRAGSSADKSRVRAARDKVNAKYSKAFKKLAE